MPDNILVMNKLQAIAERADKYTSAQSLILAIYEFVEVFDANPMLDPLQKSIVAVGTTEKAPIIRLAKEAIKEMRGVCKQVKSYAEEHRLLSSQFTGLWDAIQEFEAYDKNQIESTSGPIIGRHYALKEALFFIASSGDHRKFVSNFASLNSRGEITCFTFAPSFEAYETSRQELERIQVTRPWYSWERLAHIYLTFKDSEKNAKRAMAKNLLWSSQALNKRYQAICAVMNGNCSSETLIEADFGVDEYKRHVQRIFDYVQEFLIVADVADDCHSKVQWTYDASSGKFYNNNNVSTFIKNRNPAGVLSTLTEDQKTKKNLWWYKELYEKVVGTPPEKEQELRMYEACKQINDRCGLPDFLLFDTSSVHINPKYL